MTKIFTLLFHEFIYHFSGSLDIHHLFLWNSYQKCEQNKSASTVHYITSAILIKYILCIYFRSVAQDLSETILTMVANCSIMLSKPRQPPPGVLRTHRGIDPAFNPSSLGGQVKKYSTFRIKNQVAQAAEHLVMGWMAWVWSQDNRGVDIFLNFFTSGQVLGSIQSPVNEYWGFPWG